MEFKDYYKIMGIARDATQNEIKRAYRQQVHKFHPDVSKEAGAETRFKEVGEAYEVLKDAGKRAAYDQLGANWKAGQEFCPPPGWGTGLEFFGGGFTGGDSTNYSDFFKALFWRGSRASFHAKGDDRPAQGEQGVRHVARGIFAQACALLAPLVRGNDKAMNTSGFAMLHVLKERFPEFSSSDAHIVIAAVELMHREIRLQELLKIYALSLKP